MKRIIGVTLAMFLTLSVISSCTTSGMATVQQMSVTNVSWTHWNALEVSLKPTSDIQANKQYIVDLYEKGKLRNSTHVAWNQPELNIKQPVTVEFPISEDEFNAYFNSTSSELSHIFSVKVHE